MRLKSTCKPRKGLALFASLFASQLSFQLSTLSSLPLFNFNLEHSRSRMHIYSTSTMNIHIQHKYLFNFNLNTNIYSTSSSSISFRKLRRYNYLLHWINSFNNTRVPVQTVCLFIQQIVVNIYAMIRPSLPFQFFPPKIIQNGAAE